MQAKTLRQTNSQALVLQHTGIVTPEQTVYLSKDEALQSRKIIVHQERVDGTLPLSLERLDVSTVA